MNGRVDSSIILLFWRKVITTVTTEMAANINERTHKIILTIVDTSIFNSPNRNKTFISSLSPILCKVQTAIKQEQI